MPNKDIKGYNEILLNQLALDYHYSKELVTLTSSSSFGGGTLCQREENYTKKKKEQHQKMSSTNNTAYEYCGQTEKRLVSGFGSPFVNISVYGN